MFLFFLCGKLLVGTFEGSIMDIHLLKSVHLNVIKPLVSLYKILWRVVLLVRFKPIQFKVVTPLVCAACHPWTYLMHWGVAST